MRVESYYILYITLSNYVHTNKFAFSTNPLVVVSGKSKSNFLKQYTNKNTSFICSNVNTSFTSFINFIKASYGVNTSIGHFNLSNSS